MLQGTAELTNAEDHHDPDHQGDDLVKAQVIWTYTSRYCTRNSAIN